MSRRDNLTLIEDILESAQKIKKYTIDYNFDTFIEDDRTQDAVVRNFEIIGEASSKVDPDFKFEYSSIPWRKLKGYRNRLIHEYFGVDYQIVWEIIQDVLPDLIERLEEIASHNN